VTKTTKAKRPASDKAKRPQLDKSTISKDRDVLERNADIGGDGYDSSHKIAVCYNPACPDYRVERIGARPCACRKRAVGSLT
jgi:hypothetical protein